MFNRNETNAFLGSFSIFKKGTKELQKHIRGAYVQHFVMTTNDLDFLCLNGNLYEVRKEMFFSRKYNRIADTEALIGKPVIASVQQWRGRMHMCYIRPWNDPNKSIPASNS